MLKWLLQRQLDAFEREYGYDAGYLRAVRAADPWALVKFGKVAGLARYRKDVPKDA
jgi:hypothetical protein